jgi:hypothetical protein
VSVGVCFATTTYCPLISEHKNRLINCEHWNMIIAMVVPCRFSGLRVFVTLCALSKTKEDEQFPFVLHLKNRGAIWKNINCVFGLNGAEPARRMISTNARPQYTGALLGNSATNSRCFLNSPFHTERSVRQYVSGHIKNLADYFVTDAGKNLIDVIDEAFTEAIAENVDLEIKSL